MYVNEIAVKDNALYYAKELLKSDHTGEVKSFKNEMFEKVVEQVASGKKTFGLDFEISDALQNVILNRYKEGVAVAVQEQVTPEFFKDLPEVK